MIFRILVEQYAARDAVAKADAKNDLRFMQLALQLGRRGLGRVAPNPAVGAVLVKDGIIIGRGMTQDGGRPHAEVMALRQAGDAARGATLYVTLEPCAHHGRSPPCADAVIAAGVARVIAAMEDPNPLVAGQGFARLKAAGIAVDVGLCREEAARDHAGHVRVIRDGRPHVILKLAVSADGMIGAAGSKPVAVTGEATRARVHLLRAQCDAILIGIGTALADDPELTCRLPGMAARSPIRVVLDGALRLPVASNLVQSARVTPLWIVTREAAGAAPAALLGAAGASVIRLPFAEETPLADVMRALAERGVMRVLVEGGSRVAAALVKADLADEIWLFRGPGLIGAGGIAALDGLPLDAITVSPHYKVQGAETIGGDTLTRYERR